MGLTGPTAPYLIHLYGKDRMADVMPTKSFLQAGLPFAINTGACVVTLSKLASAGNTPPQAGTGVVGRA